MPIELIAFQMQQSIQTSSIALIYEAINSHFETTNGLRQGRKSVFFVKGVRGELFCVDVIYVMSVELDPNTRWNQTNVSAFHNKHRICLSQMFYMKKYSPGNSFLVHVGFQNRI